MKIGGLFISLVLTCIFFSRLFELSQHLSLEWLARLFVIIPTMGVVFYVLYERISYNTVKRAYSPDRVKYKFISIILIMLSMLGYSWLMLIFDVSPYPYFFYDFIVSFPLLLTFMFFYIGWVDRVQDYAEDDYYFFAKGLYTKEKDLRVYKRFLLQAAVKVIFVPMMYGSALVAFSTLLDFHWPQFSPIVFVGWLFLFGLCLDILVATSGYIFSSYIFGNKVISTDDHWLGWLVCLICYPPLLIFYRLITQQADIFIWTDWLLPNTIGYWVWAGLITLTWLLYWVSTLQFGLKFSNLSWRGLVNTGPYRYFKHPAYFSKNIYWWLHTVPFFGVYGLDMLRNILALCFVSGIYYLRAKTEEVHLSKFKDYQDYQDGIKKWLTIKK